MFAFIYTALAALITHLAHAFYLASQRNLRNPERGIRKISHSERGEKHHKASGSCEDNGLHKVTLLTGITNRIS